MDANKQQALTAASVLNYSGTPTPEQITAVADEFYNFATTVADKPDDGFAALEIAMQNNDKVAVVVTDVSGIIAAATLYYNYMSDTVTTETTEVTTETA